MKLIYSSILFVLCALSFAQGGDVEHITDAVLDENEDENQDAIALDEANDEMKKESDAIDQVVDPRQLDRLAKCLGLCRRLYSGRRRRDGRRECYRRCRRCAQAKKKKENKLRCLTNIKYFRFRRG